MSGSICALRALLLLASSASFCGCTEFSSPGTDRDLEIIFKGRCAEFLAGKINQHVDSEELRTKNCTLLWELFFNAFVYHDPCYVTMDRYADFVNEAAIRIPVDQAIYWDGYDVYSAVRSYANEGNGGTTLEFTLVGYIMNGFMYFCGQSEDPGIKYDSCPGDQECGFATGSIDAFWGAASLYFGRFGNGKVKFIVNSNRPGGAFHTENSFFTQYELVNMNSSTISHLHIYITTFLGETPGDTCESESIEKFKLMLKNKGIPYTCTDQPEDVLHVLCAGNSTAEECEFANLRSSNRAHSHRSFLGVILVVIVCLYILII